MVTDVMYGNKPEYLGPNRTTNWESANVTAWGETKSGWITEVYAYITHKNGMIVPVCFELGDRYENLVINTEKEELDDVQVGIIQSSEGVKAVKCASVGRDWPLWWTEDAEDRMCGEPVSSTEQVQTEVKL